MSHQTVPLVVIALELDMTADEVSSRFGDDVVIDTVTGLRAISSDAVRAFLTARRAAQQAEQERRVAELEEARRHPHPVQERVKALQAQQARDGGTNGALAPYLGGSR